jgi:hypothetical protein
MPTALDDGRRSPKKLLRAVAARLLGRKPHAPGSVSDRELWQALRIQACHRRGVMRVTGITAPSGALSPQLHASLGESVDRSTSGMLSIASGHRHAR